MESKGKGKILKHILVLLFMSIIFSSHSLYAASYAYKFSDASELSLWDVSGSFSDDIIGCSVDLTMNQDSKGKITGGGSAGCYMSGVTLDMSYDINGAITQKNGIANVSIFIKFRGDAYYLGERYKFSASEKVRAAIDPYNEAISGSVKASVSVAGHRESFTIPFSQTLPDDMDGSFDLSFDATQAGKKLLGGASLILSNGDIYPLSVQGTTNVKKELSQFKLKGDDMAAKGCKLTIKIDENTGDIISLKGKVLGQTLKY